MNQVIHGDCLEVMPTLPDMVAGLVLTSPPYNMRTRIRNGQYTKKEKSDNFSKKYSAFGDDLPIDEYYKFHKKVISECLRIAPVSFINIQLVTGSKEAWFQLIGDFAKSIKDIIVWDKGSGQPAMHGAVLNRGYELILILESPATAGRAFAKSYFERGTMPDIWRLGRGGNGGAKGHGAVFPVSLAEKVITNWSRSDETILDPFAGTGTTAIACLNTNRDYILIEKEKEYIDIINKRIAEHEQQLVIG